MGGGLTADGARAEGTQQTPVYGPESLLAKSGVQAGMRLVVEWGEALTMSWLQELGLSEVTAKDRIEQSAHLR